MLKFMKVIASMFAVVELLMLTFAVLHKNVRFRFVYDLTEEQESEEQTSETSNIVQWNNPCLWKFQVNISVSHLRQKLESTSDAGAGESCLFLLEICFFMALLSISSNIQLH